MITIRCSCQACGNKFESTIFGANSLFICPFCGSKAGSISDYGFGPIVPCVVLVGNDIVGEIRKNDMHKYVLLFNRKEFVLKSGYRELECYSEAAEIVSRLKFQNSK